MIPQHIYNHTINIYLQPVFQLCKIKISGISKGNDINCIMLSSQIIGELIALIKKNKYKLEKGDFIFKNEILDINSKLSDCGFISGMIINEIKFEEKKNKIIINEKRNENIADEKKNENIADEKRTKILLMKKRMNMYEKLYQKPVRNETWYQYIGKEKGVGMCWCCKKTEIAQLNFDCGHVISDHCGGQPTVENLRPICRVCNSSMGAENMREFMKRCGFVNDEISADPIQDITEI